MLDVYTHPGNPHHKIKVKIIHHLQKMCPSAFIVCVLLIFDKNTQHELFSPNTFVGVVQCTPGIRRGNVHRAPRNCKKLRISDVIRKTPINAFL